MKKLIARLKTQHGETLLESLVSILIVALSTVLLLAAITGAARVNQSVRDGDAQYQSQLRTAERGGGTIEGDLQVVIGGISHTYRVNYAGENGHLRSYDKVVTP